MSDPIPPTGFRSEENALEGLALTQRGTYQIEVFAYGRQFEYGRATGTFTK